MESKLQELCLDTKKGSAKNFRGKGPQTANIQILNNDCLLHISSFLSVPDQINFSRVGPRFNGIIEMIFKNYKTLDLRTLKGLTFRQALQFLHKAGKYFTTVCCSDDSFSRYSIIDFLPRFCHNIEHLTLISYHLKTEDLVTLKTVVLTNLTSLTIANCHIDDIGFSALKNCQRLQYLDAADNNFKGEHLSSLSSLKTLNISCCHRLLPKYFEELCKVVKLNDLNMRYCNIDKGALETLLRTQTDLEILKISNTYETENLNDAIMLPNLKDLKIYSYDRKIKNDFFGQLVKYKSKTLKSFGFFGRMLNQNDFENILQLTELEELSIEVAVNDRFLTELAIRIPNLKKFGCSECTELSENAVISYILKSKNLDYIDLSYCFPTGLVFKFILKLIDALKAADRPRPIEVFLGRTIEPDSETGVQLTEYRNFVKLSFSPVVYYPYCELVTSH